MIITFKHVMIQCYKWGYKNEIFHLILMTKQINDMIQQMFWYITLKCSYSYSFMIKHVINQEYVKV